MSILSRKLMMSAGGGALDVADVFSISPYTGNGSTQDIITGTDLSGRGCLVWIKNRSSATQDHQLFDTVRGATKELISNSTGAEATDADTLTAFNSDGFSIGADANVNTNFVPYVPWAFCISPRFLDTVEYTGNGSTGRNIPHSLGLPPGMIVVKRRDNTSGWVTYHRSLGVSSGVPDIIQLQVTNASSPGSTSLFTSEPDSDGFSVGPTLNTSGATYVAYIFAHDPLPNGVIQCGSYTGNGSATGPVINLGWEPQWLLIKRSDSTGDWWIYDNARDTSNPRTAKLLANSNAAEDTAGEDLDFTSSGFQLKTTAAGLNASGGTFVYVAIRKEDA